MEKPLVSVIIPTYNRAHFLRLTLESIASQTYQNFEVHVIDDGSPNDEAQHVCEDFEKVTYYKIENSGGPAKPRNLGIKNAKGKYFAFVDDDDIWLPTKLEKQVAILENNEDFGLVHGCCEVIDEKDVLQNKIIGRLRNIQDKHGDVKAKMIGRWTVMMPTSFVRKTVIEKVGFFNEKIHAASEDVEFWTRCSFETNFYYLDEPLVYYRIHKNNISGNKNAYIELPLNLKLVLNQAYFENKINTATYKQLNERLGINFINQLKRNPLFVISKMRIFDNFWWLKVVYLKHLISKILK
ncbi:glycosyltransferase family 2 protein [Flavobacterium okayamense]|uniref:Glycosyltransferase 2-like domain-containing protein n=1 Tax=Flavobacterium okayamense TaxID=2830782 RepID=A0ABM7S0F1_9FLAO|nr:glycosyltransferase [Flavobacterium okayamense]BCY27248.1 hypothetical protein KK2020170_01160 [Flavobacterium okayamense]